MKGKIPLCDIGTIEPLQSFLTIDRQTLNALGVFAEDFHPNQLRGRGKSKEGFSVFGLLDR
jgi:hypothetical protein